MDRGAWQATVPGVTESRTQLSDFTSLQRGGMGRAGGRFKREGIYVYLWLIHIVVRQKPTKIIKQLSLNLKYFKKRNAF